MAETLTRSERIAERYFSSQKLDHQRIPRGNEPTPDYTLTVNNERVIVEVKEFGPLGKHYPNGYCPVPFVRAKVREAWRQLQPYKDSTCCLLLADGLGLKLVLDPELLLCGMFGEMYERVAPGSYRFFGEAALKPGRNKNISAVVGLFPLQIHRNCVEAGRLEFAITRGARALTEAEADHVRQETWQYSTEVETTIRAVTIQNPFSSTIVPAGLFSGPYDEHWIQDTDGTAHRNRSGAGIAELRRLLPDWVLRFMGVSEP